MEMARGRTFQRGGTANTKSREESHMAQVESQVEALGATAVTWILFQGKEKTTESFSQERSMGLNFTPAPDQNVLLPV